MTKVMESINGQPSHYINIVSQYLPFVTVPLLSCLLTVYVHPTLSLRLKQHLQKTDSDIYETDEEQEAKMKVAKKWKIIQMECLLVTNYNIYLVMWSYTLTAEPTHTDKPKDFKSTADHYIPYIHDTVSLAVMMSLLTVVFSGLCFKWRKISFISTFSISVSINMIYAVSYWFPKMLVTFTHDPMRTFMIIVIMISMYPLALYLYILATFAKLALRRACIITRHSCKSLFYIVTSATLLLLSFYCMGLIQAISMLVIPQNDDDLHYVKVMVILIGLLEVSLFKHIHDYAYKHAIVRSKMLMLHVFNYKFWAEVDEENSGILTHTCADKDFVKQFKVANVMTV